MNLGDQITVIRLAVPALWLGWVISWMLAARWAAPTVKRPQRGRQFPNLVLTTLGAALIAAGPPATSPLTTQLYGFTLPGAWTLVVLVALGIAFCWWARLHLGTMWSGTVTQKEGHKIIDTGPYAIVRHPIYTGLLLSLAATAAFRATPLGFVGLALMTLAFYMKARLEEQFLSGDLGAEYQSYKARVPMLIPFIGV